MSTEDEQLSSIYKQAPQDVPPAHIDDAILAAARRETASRPRPAVGPFTNNWRVPAALAAVLVLSVGLVNLMDNDSLPANGYEPSLIEEAEMLQSPIATTDKATMPEEKRTLAKAPAKLAMPAEMERKRQDAKEKQAKERDAGRLSLPETAMQSPATVKPSVSGDEAPRTGMNQGMLAKQPLQENLNEQVARKQKQESLADAMPSSTPALASRIAPVPTVEDIMALRLAGKLPQANQAADAFVLHYFGDDIKNTDPVNVKLPGEEWKMFIAELRQLKRTEQADKLEQLMNSLQRK